MKGLTVILMFLLVLATALGSVACGGEEAPPGTPTPEPGTPTPAAGTPTPQPTLPPQGIEDAIEAFDRLPVEWQRVRYVNLAAFREDSALRPFYDECHQAVGQNLAATGIDLNEVDHASFVVGRAAVYSGRIDLSAMRQALEEMDYEQSTYLGVEIWESSDPERGVVALLLPGSVVVAGARDDAELCISVIGGWGDSIYDDEGVKDVITRLSESPLRVDVSRHDDPALLATGRTVEKMDSGTLEMVMVAAFRDEANAQTELTEMIAEFDAWVRVWNMVDVETVQIRRFVKSMGRADVEDVENPLGYWTYWLY